MNNVEVMDYKGNIYRGSWNERFYESKLKKNPELMTIYIIRNSDTVKIHISQDEKMKLESILSEEKIEDLNLSEETIEIINLLKSIELEDVSPEHEYYKNFKMIQEDLQGVIETMKTVKKGTENLELYEELKEIINNINLQPSLFLKYREVHKLPKKVCIELAYYDPKENKKRKIEELTKEIRELRDEAIIKKLYTEEYEKWRNRNFTTEEYSIEKKNIERIKKDVVDFINGKCDDEIVAEMFKEMFSIIESNYEKETIKIDRGLREEWKMRFHSN